MQNTRTSLAPVTPYKNFTLSKKNVRSNTKKRRKAFLGRCFFIIRSSRQWRDQNNFKMKNVFNYKLKVFNKILFLLSPLSQSSGFAFGLEQGQDVSLANRPLHVANDLEMKMKKIKTSVHYLLT